MEQEKKSTLQISGMTCAACAARLEKGLAKLPGMTEVSVNLATNRATVRFDQRRLTIEQILAKIEDIGYAGQAADSVRIELAISGMT